MRDLLQKYEYYHIFQMPHRNFISLDNFKLLKSSPKMILKKFEF